MARRSFTLLELLITIALLATLAALSLPSVLRGLAERMFVSAAEDTCEQILMARAAAQTSGQALEIVYQQQSARFEVRRVTADEEAGTIAARGSAARKPADTSGREKFSADWQDQAWPASESWAARSLGEGLRVLTQAPQTESGEREPERVQEFPPDEEPAKPGGHVAGTGPLRLAVLLPDGSALLQQPVWIVDDDGRAAKLAINPWTGLPQVDRLLNVSPDAAPARTSTAPIPSGSQPDGET